MGPNDHVLGKVNLHWVRQCRDSEPCDTQESIEWYVRAHIFCVLGTVVFPDKSTASLNSKFLPLLRDFYQISRYSWGTASLAHLYRSLCRASRYNCKEMDGPLILLFVWAWERMPFMAPIPRNQLLDIGVPLARRSSYLCLGGVIGAGIQDIHGGLQRSLGEDSMTWESTMRLSGARHHDWRDWTKEWLDMWRSGCYDTLQQEGPPQAAGPQHQEPAYDQGFQVPPHEPQFQAPTYEPQFQAPAYEHQFQAPAYDPQFMMPGYEQHYQVSAYEQHVQEPQQHQAAEPYIPQLLIPADGQLSPFVGLDSISFSRLMRETSQLFPAREQQGPVGSEPSVGRRATSGHASDFSMDRSPGHVGPTRLSAPPRTTLFDLNECPQPEKGFLGDALQHESHFGGYSARGHE
ncbi:hypothetical protein Ahy_B03g064442 [Arachis hypogaea]|uniref:Aminotransferase-like plant mobile domain-containing protein n=1 Tax=Arachis hypogaea TaxID=3818 RepID=A0A444ZZM5_ARAHY|nr:hypothetical protein Ahy_B03g064442 [Arachis hypogaea]